MHVQEARHPVDTPNACARAPLQAVKLYLPLPGDTGPVICSVHSTHNQLPTSLHIRFTSNTRTNESFRRTSHCRIVLPAYLAGRFRFRSPAISPQLWQWFDNPGMSIDVRCSTEEILIFIWFCTQRDLRTLYHGACCSVRCTVLCTNAEGIGARAYAGDGILLVKANSRLDFEWKRTSD